MKPSEIHQPGSRPIRVFLAKASMDGHWIGVAVVSQALRDAGMEVIYGGVLDARQIIASAAQEDTDVIGLNVGGSYAVVEELLSVLAGEQDFRPLVVVGGTIPPADVALLKSKGADGVFPPGSRLEDIVGFVESSVRERV